MTAQIDAHVAISIASFEPAKQPGHLLFTDEQRKAYTTVGGCHHLDGQYTVYGELIEGFDILDIIANQPRDQYDRPKKDIRITKVIIN